MPVPHLTAVPKDEASVLAEVYDLGRGVESGAQRVRRLQKEAQILAREQVDILVRDLDALAVRAAEVADGGEAYPAGVREMASRIAADLPQKAQGLGILMERVTRS